MTNYVKYQQIFMDIFSVPAHALEQDFTFKDQEQWDSLAHLQLISELEDTFEIMFDSDDILSYGSFHNGMAILRRYGVDL